MNRISESHTTSNENGDEEVSMEYDRHQTIFQLLLNQPPSDNIVETYIGSSTGWHHKDNGVGVSQTKEREILDVIALLKNETLDTTR